MYMFVLMVVILIIVGQAGGNHYNNKGGGSNYLCLPNDPDNGKPYSYANAFLSAYIQHKGHLLDLNYLIQIPYTIHHPDTLLHITHH
jgi:hypothetical protein